MTTVNGLTKERMLAIEGESIVDAHLAADHLILTKHDGTDIDVGVVRGAPGVSALDLIGQIVMFAGVNLPPRFMWCHGASLAIADYPALYNEIGNMYGAVDGFHFNLPDLRQRFPLGKAAAAPGNVMGGTGGNKDSIVISHGHNHAHTIGAGGVHAHGIGGANSDKIVIQWPGSAISHVRGAGDQVTWSHLDADGNHDHGGGTGADAAAVGVSGVDKNLPPYLVIEYMILVGDPPVGGS